MLPPAPAAASAIRAPRYARGFASYTVGYTVQYRVAGVKQVPRNFDGTTLKVTTQERLCVPGTTFCEAGLPGSGTSDTRTDAGS
jgi:hypothetical protein